MSERTIFWIVTDWATVELVEAMFDSVMDAAVGEQAGKAAPNRVEQIVFTLHIQKGLVRTSEAGLGKVLGGC